VYKKQKKKIRWGLQGGREKVGRKKIRRQKSGEGRSETASDKCK
jgi:hypothetical protein